MGEWLSCAPIAAVLQSYCTGLCWRRPVAWPDAGSRGDVILRSCVAVSPGLVAVLVAPFLGAASALANEPVCVAPNEYDWVVFGPVVRAFCGAAAAEPTPVAVLRGLVTTAPPGPPLKRECGDAQ